MGRAVVGVAHCGTHASTDQRPYASAVSSASNSTDDSPSAGAEQATPECSLAGIIGVRRGRQPIYQSRSNHTGNARSPFHSLHLYASSSGNPTYADRRLNGLARFP